MSRDWIQICSTQSNTVTDLLGVTWPSYALETRWLGRTIHHHETIDSTIERMESAGKVHEPVIYDGARHGFMRAGEGADADEANQRGAEEGWERWLDLLAATSGEAGD